MHPLPPVQDRVLDPARLEVEELQVAVVALVGPRRLHALLGLPGGCERRTPAAFGWKVPLAEVEAARSPVCELEQAPQHDLAVVAGDVEVRPARVVHD